MWVRADDEDDECLRRRPFRPCRLSRRLLTRRRWRADSSDSSGLVCDSSSEESDGDEGDDERDELGEDSEKELEGSCRDLLD